MFSTHPSLAISGFTSSERFHFYTKKMISIEKGRGWLGAQGGTDQTPVATNGLVVGNLSIVNTGIKGRVRSSIIKIPGLILHNCYPYLFIQQELIKADPNRIQMQSLQGRPIPTKFH